MIGDLLPGPPLKTRVDAFSYSSSIEISCLTPSQNAHQCLSAKGAEHSFVVIKFVDMFVISAPAHPFRFWR